MSYLSLKFRNCLMHTTYTNLPHTQQMLPLQQTTHAINPLTPYTLVHYCVTHNSTQITSIFKLNYLLQPHVICIFAARIEQSSIHFPVQYNTIKYISKGCDWFCTCFFQRQPPEVFYKKRCSYRNFTNSRENTCAQSLF